MKNDFKCPRCGCSETNVTGFNTFPGGATIYVAGCAKVCGGYFFCDRDGAPMVAPSQVITAVLELKQRLDLIEAFLRALTQPVDIGGKPH
jgi:hypothetical protein